VLTGIATIDAAAVADLDTFNLDFIGYEVSEILVDGQGVDFRRTGRELIIDPAPLLPAGEAFSVTVEYTGVPAAIPNEALPFALGWRAATDGTRYVVSEPDGASAWFPCNDHPLDKATFTFRITVPDPLLAVANGVLTDTITDIGSTTRVYEMNQPMATYLATVVIGTLEVVEDPAGTAAAGVPIRNVLPPLIAANPPPALAEQGEMLAFMDGVFGPYPFEVYGIAVIPEFPAALENTTLSLFGDGFMTYETLDLVLVHELAHQWFGDDVTPADWGDVWLNEGFATYAEWLWIERTEGPEALAEITAATREQLALATLPPPGDPPANDLFTISVYRWGGLVLHALRLEIGDDAFFATLRTYVERYGGANASTADFIAVAEERSGRQLDALFDAWLYGVEVPEL
jgi:aminopeptidase N